jgi:hypothetical protein
MDEVISVYFACIRARKTGLSPYLTEITMWERLMRKPNSITRRIIVYSLALLLPVLWALTMVYFETFVYDPVGTVQTDSANGASDLAFLMFIPLACASMVSIFLIPILLVLAFFSRRKPFLMHMCLALSLCVAAAHLSMYGSFWLTKNIRNRAMLAVAVRSEHLVKQIETYRKDNDQLPQSLADLVPKYLETVPDTGLAGYPEYEYNADTDNFSLSIQTGRLGEFDCFYYDPDPPSNVSESNKTRLGDWIYVDE